MSQDIIKLHVKNFRAIHEASIKINGITVVAGLNGCGKSTLSKLLYYVFKVTNDFGQVIVKEIDNRLISFHSAVLHLSEMMRINTQLLISVHTNLFQLSNIDILSREERILNFLDWLDEKTKDIKPLQHQKERAATIFKDLFKNTNAVKDELKQLEVAEKWSSFVFLLKTYIKNIYRRSNDHLIQKPRLYLDREIREVFHTANLPESLEVSEFSESIISKNRLMQTPFSISNVIYIDTPMLLGNTEVSYWDDVNLKLHHQSSSEVRLRRIDNLINNDVFNGKSLL